MKFLRVIVVSITLLFVCSTGLAKDKNVPHGQLHFEGFAGLCFFNPMGVTTATKGGISFEYGYEFGYLIETDHELVNGWEILISNTRTNKAGKAFFFGTATLEPDITPGSTLAGKFYFPSDANPIRGNYFGTGELEGVVVQYELVPTDLSDLSNFCGEGFPPIFGYLMSGKVHNYETP
jgi:hypothetical protein